MQFACSVCSNISYMWLLQRPLYWYWYGLQINQNSRLFTRVSKKAYTSHALLSLAAATHNILVYWQLVYRPRRRCSECFLFAYCGYRQTGRPSGQERQRNLWKPFKCDCQSVAPSQFTTHPAAAHTLPALYMSSCSCNTPLRFPPVPFTFHNPSQCPKCR